MSTNDNSRNYSRSNSQKRTLETSPNQSIEEGNKQKSIKMADSIDKNDIQELKNLIVTNTTEIKQSIQDLTNKITTLSNEITNVKKDIIDMQSRVEVLENSKRMQGNGLENITSELNAINQMKLESQLSIMNVPLNIDPNKARECIGKWANMKLDDNNIRRCAVAKPIGKNSAILQLDFYDVSAKRKLMSHIKIQQRDKNQKYVPILSEMIFEMTPTDAARGQELHFREPFTEINRNIFNTARTHKDIFVNVWISRGFIIVKTKEGKTIKVKSITELNDLISSAKRPISMEY